MAIEIKKDAAVIVANAAVAMGVIVLVALKVIDWKMALGALALLITPSIAGTQRDKSERTRDSDKDPPAPPPLPLLVTPIMTLAFALAFAGCFPVDKTVEADVGYKLQIGACIDRYKTREDIDACRAMVSAAWSKTDAAVRITMIIDAAIVDASAPIDASPAALIDASDASDAADASDASEGGSK